MSILVVQIPARERASAGAAAGNAAPRAASEYTYVLSPDGLSAASHGRSAPALLPKADSVVAVVADTDVSWHRIVLPKAPAARMRAALTGVLEDALLDEPEALHLALAPDAAGGLPTWVAATDRAWLRTHLAALEQGGATVERVVPCSWPDEAPLGHFWRPEGAPANAPLRLTLSDGNGVATLQLQGGLAHALLPQWAQAPLRWTASPSTAAPAERWLGSAVGVMTDEQRLLQAARSLWNLRQFELASRHRGARALRNALRGWRSPSWRPVRVGLLAFLALQVVALNVAAWHQRSALEDKRAAMVAVLQKAHPQVRAVLDAPLQMQRETDALRAAAGRPGEDDLEVLLHAAASAWPPGLPPVASLRYENGRLTLAGTALAPAQLEQLRSSLRPAGFAVESRDGQLVLSRAGGERS